MNNQTIGHFDVIRLKRSVVCGGHFFKKGSVGVVHFVPFGGIAVKFETTWMKPKAKNILVDFNDLDKKDFIYLFKDMSFEVCLQHLCDHVTLVDS